MLSLLALVCLSIGTAPQEQETSQLPPGAARAAEANNAFAFDLYSKLENSEGNQFVSPYSIFSILALAHAGAAGTTQNQLADVLHLAQDQPITQSDIGALHKSLRQVTNARVVLTISNGLWLQRNFDFAPGFVDTARTNGGSFLTHADFLTGPAEARNAISTWIERATGGKINGLFPLGSISPATRLVVVNAIYFKGIWDSRFDRSKTKLRPFWISGSQSVQCSLMTQEHEFGFAETGNVQVLELPYLGGKLSMLVILPTQRDGLKLVESQLSADLLTKWTSAMTQHIVDVQLPRFGAQTQLDLVPNLAALGISDALDLDRADFSGMTTSRPVAITAIRHAAVVDVDEEGTVAASATGASFGCAKHLEPQHATFHADHPFLFLIRENQTGTILFLGRLSNPL
jgi:serpin B